MKKNELKKHYIKMIHTLKHNYFIDDECRREYLRATYGKDSLKELSIDELRSVLELVGYKPQKRARSVEDRSSIYFGVGKLGECTRAQLGKIDAMWKETARDKSIYALRHFVARIVGITPLYISSLSKENANKVIVALKGLKSHALKNSKI